MEVIEINYRKPKGEWADEVFDVELKRQNAWRYYGSFNGPVSKGAYDFKMNWVKGFAASLRNGQKNSVKGVQLVSHKTGNDAASTQHFREEW